MIKILVLGDLMGKAGRRSIAKLLPKAQEQFQPDIILANGENAAGGFGITKKIYDQLTQSYGVDCVTTGNHWHDKREIYELLPQVNNLLIPANMFNVSETKRGFTILESKGGQEYAVINLSGKAFMHADNRNPFHTADEILRMVPDRIKIKIVDMHAEATSEKQGMGQYLVGRVSLVYGTHSHVPTADERIIDQHTGFITDVGMTGAYDSVIGIRKEAAIRRMTTGEKRKFEPATDDLWMCFVIAEVDPKTGQCRRIDRYRWELDRMPADVSLNETDQQS
ncbi:MAG: TIGR00282 family metallophosphoesterase [Oligoflexus sp.]